MSRWDIFRWRTLAGGRWCPVGTVQRRPRRQPRPLMASSMPRRFPPSFPVTPPQACTALWYKRRRGDTGVCGALAGCPLSRLTAPAPPRGEPSLASPFGGRWCPVGTVQRLTEPAGESAPLWGAERVRRPPPPKALLQSIEISAILELHGIPCGSLPRNGTSRLLAQSTRLAFYRRA